MARPRPARPACGGPCGRVIPFPGRPPQSPRAAQAPLSNCDPPVCAGRYSEPNDGEEQRKLLLTKAETVIAVVLRGFVAQAPLIRNNRRAKPLPLFGPHLTP
jgi:hypothetical protein